jgi:hypothetical protein
MNSPKAGLQVASVVFGLMSLVQLWRLVTGVEVLVAGTYRMPLWPNAVAFVILAALSLWLWRLSSR